MLENNRRWDELKRPKGFLFIGDPHVSSVKPGKRTDDFTASVLGKLSEAAAIAREHELIPVILGDLIHRENESSVSLISRLSLVLREFPRTPLELAGNHGRHDLSATVPDDVEYLLDAAGLIELMSDPAEVRQFTFGRSRVNLHVAPYGSLLPERVPAEEGVFNVLVTHHDLAFEGAYPGATQLRAISGVHMAVNGHMHKTAPSLSVGGTVWHCPGNIEPLSVDVRHHQPAVWSWVPGKGTKLKPHYLRHNPDCFNLVGRYVLEASDDEVLDDLDQVQEQRASLFAQALADEDGLDTERTDEAVGLLEDLDAVLADKEASDVTSQLLRMLAQEVSQSAAAAAAQ